MLKLIFSPYIKPTLNSKNLPIIILVVHVWSKSKANRNSQSCVLMICLRMAEYRSKHVENNIVKVREGFTHPLVQQNRVF
jgi:hypothetical protein